VPNKPFLDDVRQAILPRLVLIGYVGWISIQFELRNQNGRRLSSHAVKCRKCSNSFQAFYSQCATALRRRTTRDRMPPIACQGCGFWSEYVDHSQWQGAESVLLRKSHLEFKVQLIDLEASFSTEIDTGFDDCRISRSYINLAPRG